MKLFPCDKVSFTFRADDTVNYVGLPGGKRSVSCVENIGLTARLLPAGSRF